MSFTYRGDLEHVPMRATRAPFHFLYVVRFSDGVVKAGRSAIPQGRILKLIERARRRNLHATDIHVEAGGNESELLQRLRRIACIHTGREWFTGISFLVAKQLAHQVVRNDKHGRSPKVWEAGWRVSSLVRHGLKHDCASRSTPIICEEHR